jgi:hypothetical protein
MATPLSPNELQALDRKLGSLAYDLLEIASLLRSRYGENDELAMSSTAVHEQFTAVAKQLHRRAVAVRVEAGLADKSRIA